MKNLKFKVALIGIISLFVLSISLNEQLVIADGEVSDQDTSVPTEEPTSPSDGGETTEPPIDDGGNGGGETPQPPVDDGGNTGGGDTGGGNDNWNGGGNTGGNTGGNNNYTPPVTTPTQPEVPVETEPEPEPEVYVEPETPQPTAEEIALANRLWEINNRMSSRIGTSVNQGEPTEEMLLAVQTVDEDEEVEEATVEEDDDSEVAEEVAVEEDDDSEVAEEIDHETAEDLVFDNSDEESTDDEAGTSEDTPAEDKSKAELTQTDDSNEVEDQEESAVDTFTDILPTTTETYRPFILMAIGVGATLLFLAVSYLLLRRRSY